MLVDKVVVSDKEIKIRWKDGKKLKKLIDKKRDFLYNIIVIKGRCEII